MCLPGILTLQETHRPLHASLRWHWELDRFVSILRPRVVAPMGRAWQGNLTYQKLCGLLRPPQSRHLMCIPLSQVPRALLNTAISTSSLAAFRLTSMTASWSRRLTPHLKWAWSGTWTHLDTRNPEVSRNEGKCRIFNSLVPPLRLLGQQQLTR